MTSVNKCPKCGSTDMSWVQRGDEGYYICGACGYAGSHTQKEEKDSNPDIAW